MADNYFKSFSVKVVFVLIILSPYLIFGEDLSTPIDGNLKIQSSNSFFPNRILIYSDSSVLEQKDIVFESNRIYRQKSMSDIIEIKNRTVGSDVTWIDDETFVILTGNSDSYPHGILGDSIESTGFRIYKNDSLIHEYELSNGRVFETLRPLISELIPENEGVEIILTSSHRIDGARVDVFSQNGELITSSKPIGRGFRWLHTLGVMTFGKSEIPYLSIVKTPHIGGILELMYWNGLELEIVTSYRNVSSHKIGSSNLNMAMLLNNDSENSLIIVPSTDFNNLLIMTLDNNKLSEINRINLPGTLNTNLFYDKTDGQSIWLGLTNGKIVRIIE